MKSFLAGLVTALLLILVALTAMYNYPVETNQYREAGGAVHLQPRT